MTNLEKMKNFLCRQIRSMDIEQMENSQTCWKNGTTMEFPCSTWMDYSPVRSVKMFLENAQMATGPVLDGFGSMRK